MYYNGFDSFSYLFSSFNYLLGSPARWLFLVQSVDLCSARIYNNFRRHKLLVKGDLEGIDLPVLRRFRYSLLAEELGEFDKYKKYDGELCEEVLDIEVVDGEIIEEYGWQILGTNRIVEIQWTEPIIIK